MHRQYSQQLKKKVQNNKHNDKQTPQQKTSQTKCNNNAQE